MSTIQDLLEYQKVDGELRKIEQELASSDARKRALQARSFIKTAESRIAAQDKRAVELRMIRDDLIARVDETTKAIAEYADIDEIVEEGGDISFYRKNAQQLSERLRSLKAELTRVLAEIETLSAEYRKMMEQGKQMTKQYKEYSERFKEVQASRAAEIADITARLEEIGKRIPPDILERYKLKRKERIYPVLVPLAGDMCVCGMDFPLAQRGKLVSGGVIECENCHRFIYKA